MHPVFRPAALTCLFLLLTACRDSKVAAYRIPKEKDEPASASAAPPAAGGMAGGTFAQAAGGDLVWTAPEQWKPKLASAMRKGSYTVGDEGGPAADLSITAFPGDVGGDLANVNRWRGQVQLPPLAESELAGAITAVEQNGLHFSIVDLGGSEQRILGAIVPFQGATWFFKLTGPEARVEKEKPVFVSFLQTVKPPPAGEAGSLAPAAAPLPQSTNAPLPGDMANTAVLKAEGPGLKWTAPAHWQSKPPSAMRKGSYVVAGENGTTADVSITAFPGDVGGELANVNRWRGQLQLPPLAESELTGAVTHLDQGGLRLTVVDFTGGAPAKGQRMLGAIVPFQGATWFFKLTGPEVLVAREKPAFQAFLQTLQTP